MAVAEEDCAVDGADCSDEETDAHASAHRLMNTRTLATFSIAERIASLKFLDVHPRYRIKERGNARLEVLV